MTIVWSRTAVDQLVEIHDYIAQDKPDAARGIARRVQEAIRLISAHPHLGRPGKEPGTREWIVTGTPFIIPYKVEQDRLLILAILHGARRRP